MVEALETIDEKPQVSWRAPVEGTVQRMLAADGKLFVVTAEGSILCFAAGEGGDATVHSTVHTASARPDDWTVRTKAILQVAEVRDGYALVLGIDSGRMVEELVRQSDLHVIAAAHGIAGPP